MSQFSNEPKFGLDLSKGFLTDRLLPYVNENIPSSLSFLSNYLNASHKSHRVSFLEDYYPIDILPWNISANIGLQKSMSHLLTYTSKVFFKKRILLKVYFIFS